MILATVLLAATLGPQEPPPGPTPAEAKSADLATTPTGVTQAHIDAGLAAFKKRRFSRARAEFEEAGTADPGSAAAAFYLGYTWYKIGEPKGRNNADKEKAKELFAKAFTLDPTFWPAWGPQKK